MSLHALADGSLWDSPERRQSKSGKDFVAATLKIKDGDDVAWVKILAFSESLQDELMQLRGGDPLSVAGTLNADVYTPPGRQPRVSLTVFADSVMPLRAAPKPKNKNSTSPAPAQAAWDDDFPEGFGG